MNHDSADHTTLILSRHWKAPDSELSFVVRSLAGAASRTSHVSVVIPSSAGAVEPDGAFDLLGVGVRADGTWPDPSDAELLAAFPTKSTIIVDEIDSTALALLERYMPGQNVHSILSTESFGTIPLQFTPSSVSSGSGPLGLHVPVNPLAATHRHNGLGFTGYLLVLSDRMGATSVQPPTAMAAWLTARFPDANVVVVEDASAAVWRGRALRGIVSVDTRTDLWRLLAHAHITIDLAPGRIIARECVESLRFGIPIVVPAASAAAPHAAAGGGLTYTSFAELLACVARLSDSATWDIAAHQGRRYADAHYGDPVAFVSRVAQLLTP